MQIEFQFKLVTDRSISKSDFSFLFKKSLSKSTLEVSHHSQHNFSKIKNKQFVFKENHFHSLSTNKRGNPPIRSVYQKNLYPENKIQLSNNCTANFQPSQKRGQPNHQTLSRTIKPRDSYYTGFKLGSVLVGGS